MLIGKVEDALRLCGPERVFHNEHQVAVAIRADGTFCGPVQKWITRSGPTMDDAGKAAALAFSDSLESEGKRLLDWARQIRSLLKDVK
jgi:hypothetical protein